MTSLKSITNRMTLIGGMAIITAIIILPTAYIAAYPDGLPGIIGGLLAQYCHNTGECRYPILIASLVTAFLMLTSILLAFAFMLIGDDYARAADIDDLHEQLDQIQMTLDAVNAQTEKPKETEPDVAIVCLGLGMSILGLIAMILVFAKRLNGIPLLAAFVACFITIAGGALIVGLYKRILDFLQRVQARVRGSLTERRVIMILIPLVVIPGIILLYAMLNLML